MAASSTLVVDRRGLIRSVGSLLERFEDKRTPLVLAAEAIILRALSKDATGIWDINAGRRVLVAPNVLADAQRYALDQTDWCRWVSLCTGLRGVHLTYAPHLVPYIADLIQALPERSDELVRIVLLLDALPTAEMEVLTPRDLPSIQWLRTHRAHAGGVALVRACAAAGMPLAGVEAMQAQTEGFRAHRCARGCDRPSPVGRRGPALRPRVRGTFRVAGACALTPRAVWGRIRAALCAPAPWRCALS